MKGVMKLYDTYAIPSLCYLHNQNEYSGENPFQHNRIEALYYFRFNSSVVKYYLNETILF